MQIQKSRSVLTSVEREKFMGTAQPIREKEELQKFINYYQDVQPSPRNEALIVLGLHTALRISDILSLRWQDVYDFEQKCYHTHLFIREKKTGKKTVIAINSHVKKALDALKKERKAVTSDNYIFTKSTDYTAPLNRSQAYRIVKHAAEDALHEEHISCHSLRKTFGYYAWKQGTPPALLMDIYNHSSYAVTKKYLGIEQDERDSIFMEIDFYKN